VPMRASAELAVFLLSDEAHGVSGELISAVSRIDDLPYRRVR
jgi:hypothetical protein